MEPLRGQLLVAGPRLLDPNFFRTVILVAEHTEEGALGVVLNRPAQVTVRDAVPDLAALVEADEPVWVGGPVRPTAVLVLAEFEDPEQAAALVVDDVGLLATGADLEAPPVTRRARAYAGYAGWGPGQLDGELERDDWIVVPARADDVFGDRPDGLWATVLARKGWRYALLARMPPDPSVN